MPDKEFDNLFRDKFRDAEIEPSANLWANIEEQLAPKKKRSLPIYWMAAASVAIAITALLVFQKTEKIQLRADDSFANVTKADVQDAIATPNEVFAVKETARVSQTSRTVKLQAVQIKQLHTAAQLENIDEALQPNEVTARLPIKQADVRPLDVLAVKETTTENPIVIARVEPLQKMENNQIDEMDASTERKGIRNVGDLVNYVVEKVDKRERKFLKFNTDDDDNSSLVGINIGFVKLNSKKHK